VFEKSLAEVLHGAGGEGANENETDEGRNRSGPAAWLWSEEGLDPTWDVGGHDTESAGGSSGSVSMHEQGGAGQGSSSEGSLGDRCSSVFVGPSLDGPAHCSGGGSEQRVDGGGEVGGEDPPGMAVP
jgi:hypothetical protein